MVLLCAGAVYVLCAYGTLSITIAMFARVCMMSCDSDGVDVDDSSDDDVGEGSSGVCVTSSSDSRCVSSINA
jgi:hypothetical protein